MKNDIFNLKNRTALVTGGYRGIGKTVARYLADAGADIILVDLFDATEVANEIANEFDVKATAIVCDVTNPEQVKLCFDKACTEFAMPDVLFNNAGIGPHKDALELSPAEWQKVLDVNLNGVFFIAREFAKRLIAANKTGSVINTASMSGLIVNIPQKQASYNATKAAVIHLTKTLAVEWAEYGIRVNSISPGYIATDLIAKVDPVMRKEWTDMIPFKRMGKPEELAGAVIYLASEASTYTSGCNIVIDGCYTVI